VVSIIYDHMMKHVFCEFPRPFSMQSDAIVGTLLLNYIGHKGILRVKSCGDHFLILCPKIKHDLGVQKNRKHEVLACFENLNVLWLQSAI
jgi:hypothetical protein